ncbi:ABC transporter ATP-binding protein [Bacillus sp. 31A1R]|uniref:ABC transporter ATP-binding protein n=1 Tax=Robertmurraya mangrovi TaxID=3098077 RepID=A0ABU5J2Y7_9BACI|nr:ABC transporter ATP-binding protein [Bacillus sp. 31A1R]MDZ5473780.1 ABC transporter ATP-binding protein [Bacillus sp. 31A1R]
MSVLKIENLTIKKQEETIVDNVCIDIKAGEWLALVGESGSGKSVTATVIGGLLPKALKIESGNILLENQNILNLNERAFRKIRGKQISYIFQDYQGAFSPFIKIGKQFDEMLASHTTWKKRERVELTLHMLDSVNLSAQQVYNNYPFQLSGGQVQRAAIAIATILKPKLLIADEPTTALDSLTSLKVLELIYNLKEQTGCAVLFITHDLRHVKKYANNLSIMLRGKLVEYGDKKEIVEKPKHEYTKQLLSAIPPLRNSPTRLLTINTEKEKEVTIV